MNSLPDLPEMGSVRASSWGQGSYRSAALVNGAVAGLVLGLAVAAALVAISFLERHWSVAVLPFAAGVAILVWTARLSLGDFYWETDHRGLRARAWFRDRFVEWREVRYVATSLHRRECYRLATDRGSFRLPCEDSLPVLHLDVSVWQHLRRAGKAEGFDLKPVAATLWTPIADSVPREMEWTNPAPPNVRLGWIKVGVLWCVFAGAWFFANRDFGFRNVEWNWVPVALPVFSLTQGILRPLLQTVCRVAVRRDGIEMVLPGRTVVVAWHDIKTANWDYATHLVIDGCGRDTFRIPRKQGDGSDELTLAIVRGLRERDDPLLLPIPHLATYPAIWQCK